LKRQAVVLKKPLNRGCPAGAFVITAKMQRVTLEASACRAASWRDQAVDRSGPIPLSAGVVKAVVSKAGQQNWWSVGAKADRSFGQRDPSVPGLIAQKRPWSRPPSLSVFAGSSQSGKGGGSRKGPRWGPENVIRIQASCPHALARSGAQQDPGSSFCKQVLRACA